MYKEKNIKSVNKRNLTRKSHVFKNPLSLPENQKKRKENVEIPDAKRQKNPLDFKYMYCGFELVLQIIKQKNQFKL